MKPFFFSLGMVAWIVSAGCSTVVTDNTHTLASDGPDSLQLELRTRSLSTKRVPAGRTESRMVTWEPGETALIICDMWDDHTCKGAARRVAEMAPSVNEFAEAARKRGVLVIHAPSDRMSYYKDAPERLRATTAPPAQASVPIQWNYWDEDREGPPLKAIVDAGCACPEPCFNFSVDENGFRQWIPGPPLPWTKQIDTIEIHPQDAISDKGQEIYNLLEDREIENVILTGVHTNLCVSGRPFGLRQMAYHGKNVVLVRDLTDGLFQPVDPDLDHLAGNALIIKHIEETICPTILSSDLTGKSPFQFQMD